MQLEKEDNQERAPSLPRTGAELADIVKVLVKGPAEDLKNCITQANVRREIVVDLILQAKARGHRSYMQVSEAEVCKKACLLPEDGIPKELLHFFRKERRVAGQDPTTEGRHSRGRTRGRSRCF